MLEIVIRRPGGGESTLRRSSRQVTLGRSDWNDVVLTSGTVSAHHALAWIEDGAVWIRDLGSANGTFVNRVRLLGPERLAPEDEVRLGPDVTVHFRVAGGVGASMGVLAVEDVGTRTRVAFTHDRFRFGAFPGTDLWTQDGAEATLLVHGDDEVWLGMVDVEVPLALGQTFVVGGGQFRLVRSTASKTTTLKAERAHYPYRLTVTVGAEGPTVVGLENVSQNQECRVLDARNRELLHLLARRWIQDRHAGTPVEGAGWCPIAEVLVALWGEGAAEARLAEALQAARAEVRARGFDPWFLERRAGRIRARVAEARVLSVSGAG